MARLEEARIRSAYYKVSATFVCIHCKHKLYEKQKIEHLDVDIRDLLEEVARDFQDTVTYQAS